MALAHVFAFRIAGRLVHQGDLPKADRIVSMVQMVSAAAVAVIVSIPILLATTVSELNWARYTCAGIIGVVGYLVARGASRGRILQCCSASECSRLLSLSLRSNTR
jgi:hypothetical protein